MLVRFDPFRELDRFAEQVDQMFRRSAATIPMDAVRRGDRVTLEFDLPGVDPDAIDLTVEQDVLTVSASRHFERGEGDEVMASERPEGRWTRRILLGESLDLGKLEARYDRGVLTVTIPVVEQAQPRKIPVTTGAAQRTIEAESREAEPQEAEPQEAVAVAS